MPRYRNSGPSLCKVFVGNLGDRGTQHELEGAFSCFGPLRSVWIARNPPGFAFVEFEDPENALEAVSALDGSILCGGPVRVEFAHTNTRSSDRTPPSPGRCYACGERGHYARDCYEQFSGVDPENELDRIPPSPERCYACGEIGHYARDCYEQFAGADPENELDRIPTSPERCYACGEIGHYARDCYEQFVGVDPEIDLNHSFAHTGEGFGNISELCLDPETCEDCDWNSVIELMGIQPRTHDQGNRYDDSSFNSYQNPYDEQRRNTAHRPNRSDRSWQDEWNDSPSQRLWFDSPLQQRGHRPPQQNRNYTQQSNWVDSLPQHNMRTNRDRQVNLGPFRPPRVPDQTQGDRPPQRVFNDSPPQHRNNGPPQLHLNDTPQPRRSERLAQRNRNDRSQQQHTSSGAASHQSPVSKKRNDTSDDVKCAICLDTEHNPEMEYLPCGHGFHAKCCKDWLSINALCPVCRTSVASQSANAQNNPERNVDTIPTLFIGSVWFG